MECKFCQDPALSVGDEDFEDLLEIKKDYANQSVWRLRNGMQGFTDRLVDVLSKQDNVRLLLNEPVQKLEFSKDKAEKSIKIKTKTMEKDVDIVISSVYSKSRYWEIFNNFFNC